MTCLSCHPECGKCGACGCNCPVNRAKGIKHPDLIVTGALVPANPKSPLFYSGSSSVIPSNFNFGNPFDYTKEIHDLKEKVTKYEVAIRNHRDQRGDDRCWLDDNELYSVLPEGVGDADLRLCEPDVMLDNCKKYIASRHDPSERYLSPQRIIDDLKQDNDRLQQLLKKVRELIDGSE